MLVITNASLESEIANPRSKIMADMRDSKFEFYLTGSRFFGNWNQCSDWDFFTDCTDEVVLWLISLGFKIKREEGFYSNYLDSEIICVARHACGIDVQLVRDSKIKGMAQDLIMVMGLWNMIDKKNSLTTRHRYWRRAYNYIHASLGR